MESTLPAAPVPAEFTARIRGFTQLIASRLKYFVTTSGQRDAAAALGYELRASQADTRTTTGKEPDLSLKSIHGTS